ncbi:MAG: metal-dependent transcriptional regulator [Candidatus Fimenecus sp.]
MEQNRNMTASAEDYLEAIFILSQKEENARVRVTDLASFLAVSKPSVTHAVSVLKDKGLLEHEAYGGILLTPAGESCAANVLRRHKMIQRFLVHTLGVSEENAESDACRMEHILSAETIEKMYAYLEEKTMQAGETV